MNHKTVFIVGIASFLFACKASTNTNGQTPDTTGALPPVETKSPNTNYQPAFAGQTRIAGVRTKTAYEGVAISTALNRPWSMAVLPDGRFIITEKGGQMRIATSAGQLSQPITGIPTVDPAGQGGLLGITVDPQFSSNRMIYWCFSEPVQGGNHLAVAKARLADDERSLQNVAVIYRATPTYDGDMHYGGKVLVASDGNLIVSTGERSDLATRPQAQQLNSALGKILRITKDGQPASGNPFINQSGARPEIWSYGHRNTLGIAFHPQSGDLWNCEMGPRGGDEINRIEPGKNYGWPTITYGIEYSGAKIGNAITQQAGMEQPVYYWDPVLSPGGMVFYSGDALSEWKNNLFVCGLSGQHIARLVMNNNRVTGEERILASEGQRFRDIAQGKDGALYAVTDQGRLYRIAKK